MVFHTTDGKKKIQFGNYNLGIPSLMANIQIQKQKKQSLICFKFVSQPICKQ